MAPDFDAKVAVVERWQIAFKRPADVKAVHEVVVGKGLAQLERVQHGLDLVVQVAQLVRALDDEDDFYGVVEGLTLASYHDLGRCRRLPGFVFR